MNAELVSYGAVNIPRVYCKKCGSYSFVIDNKRSCCGTRVSKLSYKKYQREASGSSRRKHIPMEMKNTKLKQQGNMCFYCGRMFGATVARGGKLITLKAHWDHKVPFAFSQNDCEDNFVAACHVCNGLKSDSIFQRVDDIKSYLAKRWIDKGYSDLV